MAHQAIYRKWRPMVFDDVVGQTHITKTLKNQIMSDTVGHAYLFCGTRGTGKTTCAKILSRAVNCRNPHNGNPCNECEVCRGIIDGSIMDVTEIDAASNNGVENIRELRDDVNFVASMAKYRVYIIDEVHMLSNSAFNALLKTLEEPPENVIFILATTESHKVPQTILSRCQRFDFRRISPDDIIVRMKEIACGDGYNISEDAYRMLASLADGSLRDGLSIMERVISSCGNEMTAEDIVNTLGISTFDSVFELTDAIINENPVSVLEIIDKAVSDGKDLTQLANAMLAHFRALMICKLTAEPQQLLEYDAQTLVRIKAQSEKVSFEKINHASSLISSAQADARTAKSARLIYELAFLKLTRPEIDRSPEAVMDRLTSVEMKLANGVPASAPVQSSDNRELLSRITAIENAIKNGVQPQPQKEEKQEKSEKKKISHRLYSPIPESELNYNYPTAVLARNWSNTIETMKRMNNPYVFPLGNCVTTFDSEGIIVLVPDERYAFTQKTAVNHLNEIREAFRKVTGSEYTIKIARRSDLDDSCILNPYNLPRTSSEAPIEQKEEKETEQQQDGDLFNKFIEKFSGIITDADRVMDDLGEPPERGTQSSFEDESDDDEYESEEFLEQNELPSDEDD